MKKPKLEIGDEVTWTSQSSGYSKVKTGKVVHIVEPGCVPRFWLRLYSDQIGRTEVSYIIQTPKGKCYWPLVKYLKKTGKEKPARNTFLGPKRETRLTNLKLETKCPGKWILIDAESREIWVSKDAGNWGRPTPLELEKIKKFVKAQKP